MRRSRSALWVTLLAVGCAQPEPIPPAPAPPGAETFVSAIFDLTWTAALDHLATLGISVAERDASSGTIDTGRFALDPPEAARYADCGRRGTESAAEPYLASAAVATVEVRDNGSWSTVLVTASWDTGDSGAPFTCATRGVWEAEVQEAIRLAAEANR